MFLMKALYICFQSTKLPFKSGSTRGGNNDNSTTTTTTTNSCSKQHGLTHHHQLATPVQSPRKHFTSSINSPK